MITNSTKQWSTDNWLNEFQCRPHLMESTIEAIHNKHKITKGYSSSDYCALAAYEIMNPQTKEERGTTQ